MKRDKNILMADKDESLCDALGLFLTRLGYDVIKTNNGGSAFSLISGNPPSVIISGSQLEDMTGLHFLRHLRKDFPRIELIMIVEEGDIESGIESILIGASDYISKPVNSDALEVAIKRAYRRRERTFLIEKYKKKSEQATRNKSLFQKLFDEVPCYISLQDANFRLTGANKRFKRDFGNYVGSHCYQVYKHRKEPCWGCPVEATFKDGQQHQTEEVVTSQYGDQYNVLTWTAPIRDSTGKITQVMEMSTNITQIRKLQSHLTSLGLLIGSMSHGIRGVLTALDGGIYRLETGIRKGNKKKTDDALEVVKSMVARIRSMVLDILYYTKERDLNWAKVNVLDFSNQVAALIKPKAKKHKIDFEYEFDQSEAFFEVDPGTVSSAILNILENSIDACVDDRADKKHHKVLFGVNVNEDNIVFEVVDNGMGMDRQMRENLFSLFFSSKGNRGTGLGLFIANQIVEQHGGNIEVESEPGKGSVFRIIIPKILPKSARQADKKQSENRKLSKNMD
jgi:signal transduction histidine kinase/DNA-binding response OmpR family regulator